MFVERPDAKLYWEATGEGTPDIFLCPPRQPVAYGRLWKNQVPYLSHYFRVVTMDPRGNGRSDHTATRLRLRDALRRPARGARRGRRGRRSSSSRSPARACSRFATRSTIPTACLTWFSSARQYRQSLPQPFEEKVARVIREDFDGWRQRLFTKCLPEPHSLKAVEDMHRDGAGESSPEIYVEALRSDRRTTCSTCSASSARRRSSCTAPTIPSSRTRHGDRFAQAVPGARLVTFEGGGHALPAASR